MKWEQVPMKFTRRVGKPVGSGLPSDWSSFRPTPLMAVSVEGSPAVSVKLG
jgi:hypothetical protein